MTGGMVWKRAMRAKINLMGVFRQGTGQDSFRNSVYLDKILNKVLSKT